MCYEMPSQQEGHVPREQCADQQGLNEELSVTKDSILVFPGSMSYKSIAYKVKGVVSNGVPGMV